MNTRTAYRVCPLCEAGCGLEISVSGDQVEKIRGDKDHPMSRGFCCPKGIALKELHDDPDRLKYPVIRENGSFRRASWEEALELVDSRINEIRGKLGNNAVGIYLGNPNTHTMAGGLFIRPLLKGFKTRNFFTASTVDQMPKLAACGFLYGNPSRVPIPDIDRTDLFVVFGANPFVSNGSLMTAPDMPGRIRALGRRGGRMIVIDPVRTRTAQAGDRHLFIRPGTDVFLLAAVVNLLFTENRVELGHLTEYVDDLEKLKQAVAPFSAEAAAKMCGVPAGEIVRLTDEIATSEKCAVYGRMGTSTVQYGTLSSWLVEVVNILTGNLDKPGGLLFPRPAHVPDGSAPKKGFATGRWTSRISNAPEIMGELPSAVMAEEIESPGADQIRAFITIAGNPVVATPESRRLDAALADLDFMVSVDYYINETTRHADVILPPASILCHGHYDFFFHGLSVRNFACYSKPVLKKGADEKDKWEILAHLALIAAGKGSSASPETVEQKMIDDLVAGVIHSLGGEEKSGISAEMLTGSLSGERGPERVLDFLLRIGPYGDGFGLKPDGLDLSELTRNEHGIDLGPLLPRIGQVIANPDGKIHIYPGIFEADMKKLAGGLVNVAEQERLHLVGRRHLRTNNSWMHNVPAMSSNNFCTLWIHPEDAERLGVENGKHATVTSDVSEISVPIYITEKIMPGVVSLPHGWGHDLQGVKLSVAARNPGVNTNRLTPARTDPLSGTAVLNGILVNVAPAA